MNAFEDIVGLLVARTGYWVRTSYKVHLTKKDKARVGLPSAPRWELDVVAYSPSENCILVVECKSYLNSPGVRYDGLSGENARRARRYKLFTDSRLRKVVLGRLSKQLMSAGLTLPRPTVKLCLAAGRIRKGDEEQVKRLCRKKGWELFDRAWFRQQFEELAETDYEDEVAIMAAKLARGSKPM